MRDWIPENPYAPFELDDLPNALYEAIIKLPEDRIDEILGDEDEMIKFSVKNGYNFISQDDYELEEDTRHFSARNSFYD